MIKDRPAYLLNQPDYGKLPTEPFLLNFDTLPELVRKSLGPVGGIQPVTGAMMKAAGGTLHDVPSKGEIELFQKRQVRFQPVFIVMSIADLKKIGETLTAFPYALTLIPASKNGGIDLRDIDAVANLDVQKYLSETERCYVRFNPFTGSWSMFSPLSLFLYSDPPYEGYLDELGLVVGQYFLEPQFDPADVLEVPLDLGSPEAKEKYKKHRGKLLYSPFENVRARRIWGLESPIELFVLQELLRRGLSPTLQVLIYENGSVHASLYELWRHAELRNLPGFITAPDMYFPEKKLAVFCDSEKYHRRGKRPAKDTAIDERLNKIGVTSVRVRGKLIFSDLKAAADLVSNALGSSTG